MRQANLPCLEQAFILSKIIIFMHMQSHKKFLKCSMELVEMKATWGCLMMAYQHWRTREIHPLCFSVCRPNSFTPAEFTNCSQSIRKLLFVCSEVSTYRTVAGLLKASRPKVSGTDSERASWWHHRLLFEDSFHLCTHTKAWAGTKSNIIPPERMVVDLIWHVLEFRSIWRQFQTHFTHCAWLSTKEDNVHLIFFGKLELTSKDYPKTSFVSVQSTVYHVSICVTATGDWPLSKSLEGTEQTLCLINSKISYHLSIYKWSWLVAGWQFISVLEVTKT